MSSRETKPTATIRPSLRFSRTAGPKSAVLILKCRASEKNELSRVALKLDMTLSDAVRTAINLWLDQS